MEVRRLRKGLTNKQRGKGTVLMKQGLFEGSADPTPLQRLRGSVIVLHAAWSFTFPSEEKAAELGHLRKKDRKIVKGFTK